MAEVLWTLVSILLVLGVQRTQVSILLVLGIQRVQVSILFVSLLFLTGLSTLFLIPLPSLPKSSDTGPLFMDPLVKESATSIKCVEHHCHLNMNHLNLLPSTLLLASPVIALPFEVCATHQLLEVAGLPIGH